MEINIATFDEDGRIINIRKSIVEIKHLIDEIWKKFQHAQYEYGLEVDSTVLILNEMDCRFLIEYFKIVNPGHFNPNAFFVLNLYGLKIKKMKQKGFIFAYE